MNKLKAYFASRTERERQILFLGLGLGIPLLVWMLIWQPLLKARDAGAERLSQRQQSYLWMQEAAATITASRGGERTAAAVSGSPQQQITAAARDIGIKLSRIEPQSDGRYSVWVARSDYNAVIRFIDVLNQTGLPPDSLNINLLDVPGVVSLRASFGGAS